MSPSEDAHSGEVYAPPSSGEDVFVERHALPIFKVTLPEPDDDQPTTPESGGDVDRSQELRVDPLWKLDRRDSGSLFWRRDSVAYANSKVKFRCDVDVLEFEPREGEHAREPVQDSGSEDEDDLYNDDYSLLHDEDWHSWFRKPADLFGYQRLRRSRRGKPKEASAVMSLFCVFAILLTAYVQFTFIK